MSNWKYWHAFLLSLSVCIYMYKILPLLCQLTRISLWESGETWLWCLVSPPTLLDAHILPAVFLLCAWQGYVAQWHCGNLKLASLRYLAHLFLHAVCGIFPSAFDFTLLPCTLATLIILPLLCYPLKIKQ